MPADPRLKDLFAAAVEAPDRAAFLARACGDDADLRRRLDALLHAHDHPDPALDRPLAAPADHTIDHDDRGEADAGDVIAGRYKLLQQIGEGGMGTVWMADQTDPVKRRVAVKLIRAERSQSRTILARFEAERQAIALMDHPHIAKLLDAGTTDRGSPFFVMELVKGVPLTEFCDAHRLSVPDRLALFVQICSAVQHAHQKGVIHRDLKPSNVLVESHDGRPVPKVIDFGLAKAATGLQLTEQTLFTGFGSVLGTPLYMAPEQASFNAIDVDTRADVYALGVILYELLTGTTPLTRETVKQAAIDELLRLIREQDAPTPSSRLSSSDGAPGVAANRQTEPARLSRFVKGELDWIVMKALSKERDRRYETASGFAKDVERFLNHEPVAAGPVGVGYRVRKFVRRNRGPVAATGLVLLALVAGVAGTTVGLLEARRQAGVARDEADAKEKARAAEAGERVRADAERKKAIEFRDKALAALRATTGEDVTNLIGEKTELTANERAYLEAVAKRWQAFAAEEGDSEQSRAVRAEGHHSLAMLWNWLGRIDEARSHYERALAVRETLAADFPDTPTYRAALADSHAGLAGVLGSLRKGAEAREQRTKAIAIWEKLSAEFPSVANHRRQLAVSHSSLASLLPHLGQRAGAEEHLRIALGIHERLAAEYPNDTENRSLLAMTHTNLAAHFHGLNPHVPPLLGEASPGDNSRHLDDLSPGGAHAIPRGHGRLVRPPSLR